MANVTALGLSKIEVAAIDATTGLASGSYATLGKTYENTCKLTEEDPTENEFYCEEEDDPQESISKAGKITLTFSIMNANAAAMVNIFGGTVSSGVWSAPDKAPEVYKNVKITPRVGGVLELRRCKLRAKINAEYSKQGLFLCEVTATVLKPTVSGVAKMTYTDPS